MANTTEILDIIDSNNRVIGQCTKSEVYKKQLSHRVVHVMVCAEKKVFIPRRALGLSYLPGFYCSSAGGHVRAGESSHQGALRELEEEVGLSGPIQLLDEIFFKHDFVVHTSVYLKKFNPQTEQLHLNSEEVLSGQFLSMEEVEALDPNQFHPQLIYCLRLLKGHL